MASEESSPAFMLKHRTHDANPAHFGSLHIKVLREDKGVISLGIDAPKSVLVDRLEIFRKRQENTESPGLPHRSKEASVC